MSNKEIAECGEKQSVKGSLGSHPFKDVFSKEEAEATKKILVYDKQLGLGGADKHLPNVTFFDDIEKKQPVLSKKLALRKEFRNIDQPKRDGEITAAEIKAFQIGEPFNHKNTKDLTMAKLNANNEYSKVNPKSH